MSEEMYKNLIESQIDYIEGKKIQTQLTAQKLRRRTLKKEG